MAKHKVILEGLKEAGEQAMTDFLARFAQAYKTTPEKARELIRHSEITTIPFLDRL